MSDLFGLLVTLNAELCQMSHVTCSPISDIEQPPPPQQQQQQLAFL